MKKSEIEKTTDKLKNDPYTRKGKNSSANIYNVENTLGKTETKISVSSQMEEFIKREFSKIKRM